MGFFRMEGRCFFPPEAGRGKVGSWMAPRPMPIIQFGVYKGNLIQPVIIKLDQPKSKVPSPWQWHLKHSHAEQHGEWDGSNSPGMDSNARTWINLCVALRLVVQKTVTFAHVCTRIDCTGAPANYLLRSYLQTYPNHQTSGGSCSPGAR